MGNGPWAAAVIGECTQTSAEGRESGRSDIVARHDRAWTAGPDNLFDDLHGEIVLQTTHYGKAISLGKLGQPLPALTLMPDGTIMSA